MSILRVVAIALLLAACPPNNVPQPSPPAPSEPAPYEPPPPPPPPPPPAQNLSCLTDADCGEGGVCEGEGCGDDRPGTCAAKQRACTKDLRPYCGCDGVTFRTSGTCPGRRYASRGECPP